MTYDPKKSYTWSEQDTFELTGAEFGVIINTFRSILHIPDAGKVLMISRANEVFETIIAKAVQNNKVREVSEPVQ